MLQFLREKSSGWIATVILGLLIVPFAFFGMEQYLFQRNETFVAKVEAPPKWWQSAPSWWPMTMLWQREEVDVEEFRTAFEQARQQQRTALGEQFDPREFETADNKRRVLDAVIDRQVLQMAAGRAGIAIGDSQVREAIQSIPAFQVDGKFDAQRYQLALGSQVPPQTPKQFEQGLRESLQQALIPSQLAESAFVTSSEIDRLLKLVGEKRDVSFVVLPPPAPDTAAVSGAEVQKWYQAHASEYRAPEMVTIEYVDIDGNSLPAAPVADDAALRARYEQEKARFVEPDQRLVSHILVQVDKDADAVAQKAAEQEATQLAAQAKQPGADFAALARASSDDTGSKAAGGDLGWIQKGVMDASFDQEVFAMAAGEIRGPVKTDFGWHVLQLREVKAGTQVPFEQAREELAREQGTVDRERAFNDLTGKLVDQVYKNPSALAPAARAVGLPVQKLGPFSRESATGIAASPAVQRAAFSEALVQDGTVSDIIEIAPNHSVLIRVLEHSPERALPLAQVGPRVVAAIRADRTTKAATAAADAMVAALRKGEALQALAAARGLEATDVPGVQRGMPVPDEAASEAYFETPAPAAGKVSPGKVVNADGRAIVFAVSKVVPGDPKQAPPQQRQALQQQLAEMAGNDDAMGLVKAMRKRMKITVAEDRL
jgi:peptidyl-prolyl cis-trans isomerase D